MNSNKKIPLQALTPSPNHRFPIFHFINFMIAGEKGR